MPDEPSDNRPKASAGDQLWKSLNDELRQLASFMMRRERANHTLQATALVGEAYMRLEKQANLAAVSRTAFMAAAANTMRRLLIDHARANRADKRGGKQGASDRIGLSGVELSADAGEVDPLDIDRALLELKELDERAARIVEMKFFGGMGHDDIATHLGISPRLVDAEWAHAKGWLRKRLSAYGNS